eukprot:Nitzschia sp. Nitz4//scaffold103_size77763//57262//57831//NITZ4_005449-RA/size77763-processed-gene-0.28-mRNA-1//-1//CDS//3329532340//6941//frame0
MDEESGNIFDALDAAEAQDAETEKAVQITRDPQVYHVPVKLHKDEATGEQYFYLQKGTFPNRNIYHLNITYSDDEKAQMTEQVVADKHCPQVILKNVRVECLLQKEPSADKGTEYLNDESFRLSGSKIVSIGMRMYAQQKEEAQKQLEDPACEKVVLTLDIECRLGKRESDPEPEPELASEPAPETSQE